MWKAKTGIINRLLTTVIIHHDSLHGVRTGRGAGTSTLKYKLLHQLTVGGSAIFLEKFKKQPKITKLGIIV